LSEFRKLEKIFLLCGYIGNRDVFFLEKSLPALLKIIFPPISCVCLCGRAKEKL